MTNRSFQFINQLLHSIDVLLEVHEVGEQTCNYFKSSSREWFFHAEIS